MRLIDLQTSSFHCEVPYCIVVFFNRYRLSLLATKKINIKFEGNEKAYKFQGYQYICNILKGPISSTGAFSHFLLIVPLN